MSDVTVTSTPPTLVVSTPPPSSASTLTTPPSWLSTSSFGGLRSLYASFHERRATLGLSNPGTIESLTKEVTRDVFLNNGMFTGLRADLSKGFSVSPVFQTSHGFMVGGGGVPPYTFMSTYGTPKVLLHGTVDNELSLNGRCNYRWNDSWVTRSTLGFGAGPGQSMVQIDNDYQGRDFSASLKTLNPSLLDGGLTGIVIGSYLQSVTPRLALGLEAIWQRAAMSAGPESAVSYAARYRGSDWIATAQLQAAGALSTTFWRKLGDRVEAGAQLEMQLLGGGGGGGMMGGPSGGREGVATVGAKYDFRAASFRAQADSQGKLSVLVEKRLLQLPIQVTVAAELDQPKQQAKVGFGVSLEISDPAVMEQQEKAAHLPPPPY